MSLNNQRSANRRAVMKAGQITFYPNNRVTCTVRDLSKTGALVEAKGIIPDSFYLTLEMEATRQHCAVVWRKGTRMGVKF